MGVLPISSSSGVVKGVRFVEDLYCELTMRPYSVLLTVESPLWTSMPHASLLDPAPTAMTSTGVSAEGVANSIIGTLAASRCLNKLAARRIRGNVG